MTITTCLLATSRGIEAARIYAAALARTGLRIEFEKLPEAIDGIEFSDAEYRVTWRVPTPPLATETVDWEEVDADSARQATEESSPLSELWSRRIELYGATMQFLGRAPEVLGPQAK